MFCSKCGTQIAEGAAFCANCGSAVTVEATPVAEVAAPVVEAPVETAAPAYQEPTYQAPEYQAPTYQEPTYQAPTYQAPTYNAAPVQSVDAGSLMIRGILAIALCWTGIAGLILGSMAKKMAAQFMAENGGQIFGKAKTGSILGRLGFGFGLGFTIFWGIYFLIFVIALGSI